MTTAATTGVWAERTGIDPPPEAILVDVSDRAPVYVTASVPLAYLFDEESVEIPSAEATPFGPAIDRDLLVWYEANYEGPTPEHFGLYTHRLPDGPTFRLVDPGRPTEAPQVSGNRVSWVEGRPKDIDPNLEEIWELPISVVEINAQGERLTEPELLVAGPTAILLGDSGWNYDLSDEYPAFEVHEATPELEAGLHVLELATGQEALVAVDGWTPSLSGSLLIYDGSYRSNLTLRDLTTGNERLLDPKGFFGSLGGSFVAYSAGSVGEQVVVSSLDGCKPRGPRDPRHAPTIPLEYRHLRQLRRLHRSRGRTPHL